MIASLAARRQRIAAALNLRDELLLVGAGEPIPLPEGSDQTYPFISHAEFFYATGVECQGAVVAFDPRDGAQDGWVDFVPEVTESERVWEGRTQLPGRPRAELDAWLRKRTGRPIIMLGAPLRGLVYDEARTLQARTAFTHVRRRKDAGEIALLRQAANATAAGFALLREKLASSVTERALQIELEAEFFRHGGTKTGYGTIVGTGPNAAVLHFAPSNRACQPGDFVLVDAGAEINRYTADVTRTYAVGALSAFQQDLYRVVLAAQERAVARCWAGTEWKAIHLATAIDLVTGLVAMDVMRGSPSALVEQEAHTLFFPHGLGHMVGLGVRDASGLYPGRTRDTRPCLRTLRMDLPLEEGYVVTVEPGLYFIPPLLNDPARRTRYRDCVNWPLVDRQLQIGGVRIEDNVLVTAGDPDVLTAAIPKNL